MPKIALNKLLIILLLIPMVSFGDGKVNLKLPDGTVINGVPDSVTKMNKEDINPYLVNLLAKRLSILERAYDLALKNCNVQNNITPLPPLPNLPLMPCEDALEGMPCLKLP